jgi:hypothetical protein
MILSKVGKLVLLAGLLCFLLMGFTGASYAQIQNTNTIRWDVFPSPTEVITTGRSEVLGSISLYVQNGQGTVVTGNALGGPTQIGISYLNRIMIDNTTTTGIRVFAPRFATSGPQPWLSVQNLNATGGTGICMGFITLNIPANITLFEHDVIRIDGVRGRIDMSDGSTAGTNMYVQLQTVNDPAANLFYPETIRVATSYPGLQVKVAYAGPLLCLPSYGAFSSAVPAYSIQIQEGFNRAFVAADSNIAGPDSTDRVDSKSELLGAPTRGTRMKVIINHLPASVKVADIVWPATVYSDQGTFSSLKTVSGTYTYKAGTAGVTNDGYSQQTYEFFTTNQAGQSDALLESFTIIAALPLDSFNQTDVGTSYAAATLTGAPGGSSSSPESWSTIDCTLNQPQTSYAQPRFVELWQSFDKTLGNITSTDRLSTTFGRYADFSRCVCYLLFPYVTVDKGVTPPPGTFNWDTGISVSNTTDDVAVFGTANGAPRQIGTVTFFLYDNKQGYIGSSSDSVLYGPGKGFAGLLSNIIAPLQATFPGTGGYVANGGFHGYTIAAANFQFCHGYAFISDQTFNQISQGYVASVIPDPAIKSRRVASAAADTVNRLPAGESLNN